MNPSTPFAQPDPTGASGNVPTMLDAASLDRLRELDPTGENRLLARVLKAFESSISRLLPQLDASMADGNLEGVRHVAHTLKSSSASIGALRLSQLCAEIEGRVRRAQGEPVAELVSEMRVETRRVQSALALLVENPS